MNKQFISFIISFFIFYTFSSNIFAAADILRGKEKYKVCASCHGANGEGQKISNAPRISGQQSWYIKRQLINYKLGIRGTHPKDITGMQMRTMSMTLYTENDIEDIVAYIGTLDGRGKHIGINGDIEAGKSAYTVCLTCHGANGEGNTALNSPKIAGLQDWYVERQLHNFKIGVRGVHQKDIYGQQMRPMAMALASDQAIRNVTAYVSTLKSVSMAKPAGVKSKKVTAIMKSAVSEPLYVACASCHGSNGEGNQRLGAPRLAGQPGWYIERQLRNWRDGIRGTHSEDVYGMQMRPMAMTLIKDSDLRRVVEYITTLRGAPSETSIQGDIDLGKTAYATCTACHGSQGEGNKALNAPKIAGLPDWYVVRQLKSFKKGIRGTHQKDIYGQQMRPMAMALANDEAMKNVAAYVATFKEKLVAVEEKTSEPTSVETIALSSLGSAENGKALYSVCVSCHGADGAGNKALNAPRIAGQQEWYLKRQLAAFKSGMRGTHSEDIYGMQMRPMSMTLTNEQAIADVSAYVNSLDGPISETTIKGDVTAGKASYMVCVSCHGANGEGNKALNAPKLSGMQDWYIARQLQHFKKGIRGANPKDTYGMQMAPMAMTLPDNKAIENIAAYISTLR
jgi:cytochrome c553